MKSCLLHKTIIETLIISYLIYALTQKSNFVIVGFCIISLLIHILQLIQAHQAPCETGKKYGISHKIVMISIALFLLIHCISSTNPVIINLGWFVFLSKLLDFFSDQNTLLEEFLTFLVSSILTKHHSSIT